MEIAGFLGKLKGGEKVEPQKFLALILTDEVVQAAVWNVSGEVTEVVAVGTPVEWDGDTGTTGELITAVDATISSAVEGLGDEPNSVILGIPHSWTDKNGVLGVKREFISKIRKELELEAIGYVVITDSILSYLKMQEGTPTTSILIQVARDEFTLVLVRLGRIEAIETIGRSDDVVEDIIEGITRFKIADNLPSRIILFNSMHNLDEIIQNLLSVDWPTQFNFLHTPKIEALAKDVAIRALVVAGGSEVAKSLGIAVTTPSPVVVVESPTLPEAQPIKEEDFLSAQEIGFTEETVKTVKKEKVDFIDPEDEPPADEPPSPSKPPKKQSRTPFVIPTFHLPKISLPKFKLNLSSGKPIWWYLGGSLLALGILAFYLVWLLPKATLTFRILSKPLEEDVELTLSASASSIDFADRIVPATIESVSESGDKSIETTGKKIVGNPAKGEVSIYNRTSAVKTFAKGTTLSYGSLKFSLDQDVTVASKSAGSDYVDVPGKSSVSITASAIGTESNVAAGTEFTVMNFGKDSYVAKNDTALAGGTSEEVQVVSKDDQKNLAKSLTDELLQTMTAKSGGSTTPGIGVYLLADSAKADSATYSAKIGDTAKTLSLSMTLSTTLLKYKTQDVTTLVDSSIDQAVPQGYVRADLPSTVDLSASSADPSGGSVKGNAKVKVALLPTIDKAGLISAIKGKNASSIEPILKAAIPGYDSAEIVITPHWIPSRLKSLPLNPKNITIMLSPLSL